MARLFVQIILILILVGCGSAEKPSANAQQKPSNQNVRAEDGLDKSSARTADPAYKQVNFRDLNYFSVMNPWQQPSPFDTFEEFGAVPQNTDDIINKQVPVEVLKLDGVDVEISGFVYPMTLKEGKTSGFMLMSILPSCCFGDVLNLNDIVYVDALNDLKDLKKDQFVTIRGKLSIGYSRGAEDWMTFLYWLKAKEVLLGRP